MKRHLKALKEVFKKYENLEIDSYLKSLPYFLLTGRKGFYFFRNEKTSLTVAVHPHKENTLLVFPEYDGNGDLTLEVLKHLSKTGFDIQLARYTQKDFENLQAALKKDRDRIIKSITIKEEGILDWRYPSRILDVKKTFEMKGKDFATLRNKFNKVANNKEYQVVPLSDPEAEKVIRSTIFHWLSSLAYIGRETGANTSMFYETLLENIKHSPEMFDGFAIKTDKEAIGFVVWDVSGETANALAGLNQRRIPGLSEFQVVQACKMLNERGVKKYNLGGSETESLDKYKLKFHPVESVKMFSCDVDFDKNKKLPFEMINVIGGKDGLDL